MKPTPDAPSARPPQGGATSGPARPVPRWPLRGVITETRFPAREWFAWAGALAALLLVFTLYTRPDFLVMVADQISACF
jgi:hypothetical protein